MKALQIFNAIVLALTATFALTLGVVTLMYAVNLDASPRMRAEWPAVAGATTVFWVLGAFAGATFWAQRHRYWWRWIAQGSSALVLGLGATLLLRILGL